MARLLSSEMTAATSVTDTVPTSVRGAASQAATVTRPAARRARSTAS